MSCELKMQYSLLDNVSSVWKNFAEGFLYESDLSSAADCLKKLVDYANQINFENKSHSRMEVLDRIAKRGIQFSSRLDSTGSDTTEFLGLIGEMLTEDFILRNGFHFFYIKWRNKGTSKSKGIDMIAINNNEETKKFFLIEAKHVHKIAGDVANEIKRRFEDGIGEFDNEKTLYNLAGLSTEFSIAISKNRQFGLSTQELENNCKFLEQRMENKDYNIIIVTCIDKTKYNQTDFKKLMKNISSETDIGSILYLSLNVLKINLLEEKTNLILAGN